VSYEVQIVAVNTTGCRCGDDCVKAVAMWEADRRGPEQDRRKGLSDFGN